MELPREVHLNLKCLTFLILSLWVYSVVGLYELEITLHSYRNPTGRCHECIMSACCDDNYSRPPHESCPQNSTCDTGVRYCFKPVEANSTPCHQSEFTLAPDILEDTNEITSFGDSFFGASNPIQMTGNTSWEGILFYLEFLDSILTNSTGPNEVKVIDRISIKIVKIPVGTSIPKATYTGDADIAEINVSFSVRCATDYYGQGCLTFCPDFDNCAGCGLSAFTGEFCQFFIAKCNLISCNNHGQCVDGRVCACNGGFIGDNCETIDYCINITCSGNGRCMTLPGRFTCICDPGYKGELCEMANCTGANCMNDKSIVGAITGGVIGSALLFATILTIICIIIILIYKKNNSILKHAPMQYKATEEVPPPEPEEEIELVPNQVYGKVIIEEIEPVEIIELTSNQLYGKLTQEEPDYETVDNFY